MHTRLMVLEAIRPRGILFADDGSGGGGGGGSGGGDGKGGDGKEPAKPFTPEQQAELSKIMNSAITGHLKRFADKTTETFSTLLDEKLKAIIPAAAKSDDKGGDNGGGGKGADLPDAVKAMLAKQQDEIARLTRENQERDKKSKERDLEIARGQEKSALAEALRKAGIPEPRVAGATAMLFLERGVVARAEDGAIGWRFKRDGYEEILPLEKGVAEWLGTDEGKAYAPAVEAGGAGSRGGGAPGPKPGQKMTKEQAAAIISEAMLRGEL